MSSPASDPGSDPRSGRARRVWRALIGLLLLWHGVATMGSLLGDTIVGESLGLEPVGKAIRTWTRDYERAIGSYQTWAMFAPNPPRNTRWMEIDVQGARFEQPEVLLPLTGEQARTGIMWDYDRLNKLERTLLKENRKLGRIALLNHTCRVRAAAGEPAYKLTLMKVTRKIPPPSRAREVLEVERQTMNSLECPR